MYLDEAIYNIVVKEAKEVKSFVGRKVKAKTSNHLDNGVEKGEIVEIVRENKNSFTISKTKSGYDNMKIEKPLNLKKWKIIETNKDTIVEAIVDKFKERSEVGIKKYNTTLDREDFTTEQWIDSAIEEAMDMILYLERLKRDITNIKKAVIDGK